MKNFPVQKLTMTALFTAIGIIIPFLFHSVYMFGNIFLPMHFPVIICAMIIGPFYGSVCAVLSVLLSSFFTGLPPLYPVAVIMCFELVTYSVVSGLLIKVLPKRLHKIINYYISLLAAMLTGRLVLGAVSVVIIGMMGNGYSFKAFIGSALITALPGITIQLIVIPWLTLLLYKIRFGREET